MKRMLSLIAVGLLASSASLAGDFNSLVQPVFAYISSSQTVTAGFANTYVYSDETSDLIQLGGLLATAETDEALAVESIEQSGAAYSAQGNRLLLTSDCPLRIYSLAGTVVSTLQRKGQSSVLQPGIYIVEQGGKARKWVVK